VIGVLALGQPLVMPPRKLVDAPLAQPWLGAAVCGRGRHRCHVLVESVRSNVRHRYHWATTGQIIGPQSCGPQMCLFDLVPLCNRTSVQQPVVIGFLAFFNRTAGLRLSTLKTLTCAPFIAFCPDVRFGSPLRRQIAKESVLKALALIAVTPRVLRADLLWGDADRLQHPG